MSENNIVIETKKLTKDFGDGKGIFDLNIQVHEGEMLGYVGTNGSGKTTTLRSMLGFIKPTSGHAFIEGKESWENSSDIVKDIGYVPGEIAFPDLPTGIDFLKSQAEYIGLKDFSYANQLIEKLQLDPKANLKRMSKGMKQKTALVAALMKNPKILLLDEPTTGLDPLMRQAFMEIIMEEHKKGKTIVMSTHMFEEVEESCDSVALISNGHIIDKVEMETIRKRPSKDYKIEFNDHQDYLDFKALGFTVVRDQEKLSQVTVNVPNEKVNELLRSLLGKNVKFMSEVPYTIERHFEEIMSKQGK